MRKVNLIILFFILITQIDFVFANDKIINEIKSGGKLIFIRHALAPGNGDPEIFDLYDCSTQRNLNSKGIEQSIQIGIFFKKNNIPIDIVLTSEWCRCKDTAKYAFKNFITFNALNSFYDEKFYKNKEKQVKDLKLYIKNWKGKKNLILITHFVVIQEILNISANSGELVVSEKNFELIGTIETM